MSNNFFYHWCHQISLKSWLVVGGSQCSLSHSCQPLIGGEVFAPPPLLIGENVGCLGGMFHVIQFWWIFPGWTFSMGNKNILPVRVLYSRIGWNDFWERKIGHVSWCAQLLQDPNPKISLWNVAWPQKSLTVNQKWAKRRRGGCFLWFIKNQKWR